MALCQANLYANPPRVTIGQPVQLQLVIQNFLATSIQVVGVQHFILTTSGTYDGKPPANLQGALNFTGEPFPMGINPTNQITSGPLAGTPGLALGNTIQANGTSTWLYNWLWWPSNFRPDVNLIQNFWVSCNINLSDGTVLQPVAPCQITIAQAQSVGTNRAADTFAQWALETPTYPSNLPQYGGLSYDMTGFGNSFFPV